jgi:hypothetical protein
LFFNKCIAFIFNDKLFQSILSKLFSNKCIAFSLYDKLNQSILSRLFSNKDIAFELLDILSQSILSYGIQFCNLIKIEFIIYYIFRNSIFNLTL